MIVPWILCIHCMQRHDDHVGNKCLFEPTWFKEALCIKCCKPCSVACAVIRAYDCDWFICSACDATAYSSGLYRILGSRKRFVENYIREKKLL